jgi:hypothetical protein
MAMMWSRSEVAAPHIGIRRHIGIQSVETRSRVVSNSEVSSKLCMPFARMARVPIEPAVLYRLGGFTSAGANSAAAAWRVCS